MTGTLSAGAFALFAFALFAAPAFAADPPAERCRDCHDEKTLDPTGAGSRRHVPCKECHNGYEDVCRQGKPLGEIRAKTSTETSLAKLLVKRAPKDPVSAAACTGCHADIAGAYFRGVHGKALIQENNADTPYCIDCHGAPHNHGRKHGQDDPALRKEQLKRCIHCHEDKEITHRNELEHEIAETYLDTTHAKLVMLGRLKGAACWDCHAAHDILPKEAPGSLVATASVAATCGKCHTGSTIEFASAFVHRPLDWKVFAIGKGVAMFFSWLTFLTIAALLFHLGLDLIYQVRKMLGQTGEEE